jgi:hypothetical protein
MRKSIVAQPIGAASRASRSPSRSRSRDSNAPEGTSSNELRAVMSAKQVAPLSCRPQLLLTLSWRSGRFIGKTAALWNRCRFYFKSSAWKTLPKGALSPRSVCIPSCNISVPSSGAFDLFNPAEGAALPSKLAFVRLPTRSSGAGSLRAAFPVVGAKSPRLEVGMRLSASVARRPKPLTHPYDSEGSQ